MARVIEGSEIPGILRSHLANARRIRVVTPFLTLPGARLFTHLLAAHKSTNYSVDFLVRFDERSIGAGVCDPEAIRYLWTTCASKGYAFRCKMLPTIHAKMYLITRQKTDTRVDIVGSANLSQ